MVSAPTDETLLAGYVDGDAASFELLVRRYAPELYQFVLRFTASSAAAEDVVQETFLQVHSSASSFDPQRRFKPWLFTIAANKARDYLRKRSRQRELPFDRFVDQDEDAGRTYADLLAAEPVSPDDDLTLEERRRAVKDVVEALPLKLREVLVLSYFHRFSYRDIAETLAVPLGTVKSRLHAAIAQFAGHYDTRARQRGKIERLEDRKIERSED